MIFVIIFFTIVIVCLFSFKITFYRSRKDDNIYNIPPGEDYQTQKDYFVSLIDNFNKISYEDVYITAFDGLKLHGRYYHCNDNSPIDICFHGYRGTGVRDFCGGTKTCFKSKHNVLVIDQRAHGLSEGKTITFGIKERYDCVAWIEYIVKRFPQNKILLYGISMGATTILMASNLNLPQNVVGIIADSPFSKPDAIIKKVMSDMHLPVSVMYPLVYLSALIFGRFKLNSASATESVKNTKIPILLIHGKKDSFVPYEMSKEISSNAPSLFKLYECEGAEHGISYIVNEKEYENLVKKFLKKVLK